MDIMTLKQIIFKPSSNLMKTKGNEIFKKDFVKKVRGKRIDSIYHIYGDIKNKDNATEFSTHIKIDLAKGTVINTRCNCSLFKDFSQNKPLFMCDHLTATAYKFIDSLKKRNESHTYSDKQTDIDTKEKSILTMQISLISKSFKEYSTYEAEFRIGLKHKYLITNLNQFISSILNKNYIYIDDHLKYDLKEYEINQNHRKLLHFLKQKLQNSSVSLNGRSILLDSSELKDFFKALVNEKIQFKYKSIEYSPTIFNEDLPLSFTLKDDNAHFILTTHKKLPTMLDTKANVFFFNGNIYLPSKNQTCNYLPFYNRFIEEDSLTFVKTEENYDMLILKITSISKDISLSEGVKNFSLNYLKFEFLIFKANATICCKVYGLYFDNKIDILVDKKNSLSNIRDYAKENKVLMKLEALRFICKEDKLLFIGNDPDLFDLLANTENNIHKLGKVTFGKGFETVKIYNSTNVKIDFYDENSYIKIVYQIGDMSVSELNSAHEAYKSGDNFYKDSNNNFLDFRDEGILRFFNLLDLLSNDKTSYDGTLYIDKDKLPYANHLLNNSNYVMNNFSKQLQNIEQNLFDFKNNTVLVPRELKASLRDYQIKGFKWLRDLSNLGFGGILADEMGLGKTVQTIAFITSEINKKFLIVTPTSLIYNWKDELERFSPDIKFEIIHGNKNKTENLSELIENNTVILTTYGTLKNNVQSYIDSYFDYCIIDEAQNIKNSASKTKLAIKSIKAKVHFALTGTPLENTLTELWSIFDFVMPNYLLSKESFEKKFSANDYESIELLKTLISPFILRRTKQEVIDELPDKVEKTLIIEMTSMQKSIYSSYIKDIRKSLRDASKGKIEIFSYLTKLRQICLDPSLLIPNYSGGSSKLEAAISIIEDQIESNGKVLLFSQFTSALAKIADDLEKQNIAYYYIDGSTPAKERLRLVNEFNQSDNVSVFLISLKAGGTGLNLTSANLVIHFDPWWNPAVEDQATDRAHRIGQKNIVEVIKLVAKGTIEENILTLQHNKKQLIDSILTGELKDSDSFDRLSKEDLLSLFDRTE
ncbi:DEAD/DEAH box helicase [Clostridium folliculivorans]|uniref:DNA helicase n=1 Tax=Clostridium folliculivorans TaxID=2886038 RepID=A0A9W6DAD0_9CLOT|nr:DEAD/DEAH box helicase [Clostridium folliculivorans]GKU24543.1 DNA helicase [Clostridium folliculivorans]GKU30641.1 DNA helicase [Clostridium folliculivorans]